MEVNVIYALIWAELVEVYFDYTINSPSKTKSALQTEWLETVGWRFAHHGFGFQQYDAYLFYTMPLLYQATCLSGA